MAHVAELSDVDLHHHFATEPRWGGAVSRDRLPELRDRFFIVNLEASRRRNGQPLAGTHWVMLYACRPGVAYYMDSMGEVDAPNSVVARVRESGKRLVASPYQLQSYRSVVCGYEAAYACREMLKGREFEDVITKDLVPKAFARNNRVVLNDWHASS